MFDLQTQRELTQLRSEMERLLRERQLLLRVAAVAAVLVNELDPDTYETYDSAELLAAFLNQVDGSTLRQAVMGERERMFLGPAGLPQA